MIDEINDYTSGKSKTISPEIKQGAKDWLGIDIDNKRSARKLVNDLMKIRNNLASKGKDDFRVDLDTNAYAFVLPYGSRIYLGQSFFSLKNGIPGLGANQSSREGTLLHESTHFLFVLGTNFFSKELYPHQAVIRAPTTKNAQNWKFFFQGYAFR